MDLNSIEQHIRHQQSILGEFADNESFDMVFSVIDQVRKLQAENEKLAALNRHYFFKFYDGSIEKMMKDNAYLLGD